MASRLSFCQSMMPANSFARAGRALQTAPVNASRALVPALSLTLLISWGSLYYAFAVLVRPLQADLRSSAAQAMGAYSVALVVWGLCAYPVGRVVDRYGGRCAMTVGSCLCALLFVVLSRTHSLGVF